jgi:hypothetical protein
VPLSVRLVNTSSCPYPSLVLNAAMPYPALVVNVAVKLVRPIVRFMNMAGCIFQSIEVMLWNGSGTEVELFSAVELRGRQKKEARGGITEELAEPRGISPGREPASFCYECAILSSSWKPLQKEYGSRTSLTLKR